MKTVLKVLVAIIVIVAAARWGESAWRFYEFKDSVEQETRIGGAKTTTELHRRLVQLATEQGVAVAPDDVVVERRGELAHVTASYTEAITLVPGFYTRQQLYELEVNIRPVTLLRDEP